ncbi:hypothetical protein [Streptosporangium longisporum]|uniref:hypothetical protein n=1 Tax=Streptosporangium longisporum TaxID=46187 RepID=UPI0031EB12CB
MYAIPAASSTALPSATVRRYRPSRSSPSTGPQTASRELARLARSLAYFQRMTSGTTGARNADVSRSAEIRSAVRSVPEG